MAEISIENIKTLFCRITGESVEGFGYSDLISNSAGHIKSSLTVEALDEAGAARCEYAAAAAAVYAYTFEKTQSDRVMLSENGAAYCGRKSQEALKSADQFRSAAFAGLRGIAADDGFWFSTV